MRKIHHPITIALIFCLAAPSLGWPASAQTGRVTCSSNDERYHYCRVDTDNYARLVRQISGSPCDQGYSWGYDARGIWVDRGCRAEFEFGRSSGGGDHTGRNAAIAAGIIGAIVVGAVVASKSGKGDDRDNVDPQKRQWYNDGYRIGQKDYDDGGGANPQIWSNRAPRQYVSDFEAGYDDGYHNRRKRY